MELGKGRRILSGIIAYVEVWSSSRTENYSKAFIQQLLDMGAKISRTLNKQVTHVIFKDGLLSTWNRAQKAGIKLVSVLWVQKCREDGVRADESLYPAVNTNGGLPQFIKKHKCMQPKDFFGKTPEKDRRLQKRMETMVKELEMQKAATETDIPVLLFEDDGSLVYSPASKIKYECSAMERRIKDMKEKRENLSPTASQLSEMSDFDPAVVSTNSMSALTSELESRHLLNSSCIKMIRNAETENLGTEASNSFADTEKGMDVSITELYSSLDPTSDSKHSSSKQARGKHLEKEPILPNSKGCDFPVKKTMSDLLSSPKDNDGNKWFLANAGNQLSPVNNLDYRVSDANLSQFEGSESTSNNNSENDFPSVNLIHSPVATKCSLLKQHKYQRKKSSLGLKASTLNDKEPPNDFLHAVLTPVKSTKDQDSSFEDYFSPSNDTKKKLRASLPFPCLKKLQSPNEIEYNSPRNKLENTFHGCNQITPVYSRKRKRVTEITKETSSKIMVSVPLETKKPAAVNGMSKNENGIMAETSDCLNFKIQKQIFTSNVNKSSPSDNDKLLMSDAKDTSCAILGDPKNESNTKLKNIRRIKKPLRTLVMTSMSSEKRKIIVQVMKKLGGFQSSDEVCKNTSHIIAGSPRRTLNVLMGIARGCWIVSYKWVLWSLEYGYWISEEPFELSMDFPAAPISRFQQELPRDKDYQKLFSNQPIMFISHTSQPPYQKLCELVQLCGGKTCKTLRQAAICIGQCNVGKYVNMQCLSEKWIIDSITQNKICPLENYMLQKMI